MKIKEISQAAMENYVPAFTSATDEVFTLCKGEIAIQKGKVETMIGKIETADEDILQAAEALACLRTGYYMVPQIDLTVTPEGFGIVNNDHVSPASKERVNDLREQLRHKCSEVYDDLRRQLAEKTAWGETRNGRKQMSMLMWCPFVCEEYGVRHDGKMIYQEEYSLERAAIAESESLVKSIISFELYEKLLVWWKPDEDVAYTTLRDICLRLIAANLLGEEGRNTYRMTRYELQSYLNRHKNVLKEYADSDIARSHAMGYKNKKEDGAFFFF